MQQELHIPDWRNVLTHDLSPDERMMNDPASKGAVPSGVIDVI
jgi:hypothetical protein